MARDHIASLSYTEHMHLAFNRNNDLLTGFIYFQLQTIRHQIRLCTLIWANDSALFGDGPTSISLPDGLQNRSFRSLPQPRHILDIEFIFLLFLYTNQQ